MNVYSSTSLQLCDFSLAVFSNLGRLLDLARTEIWLAGHNQMGKN